MLASKASSSFTMPLAASTCHSLKDYGACSWSDSGAKDTCFGPADGPAAHPLGVLGTLEMQRAVSDGVMEHVRLLRAATIRSYDCQHQSQGSKACT